MIRAEDDPLLPPVPSSTPFPSIELSEAAPNEETELVEHALAGPKARNYPPPRSAREAEFLKDPVLSFSTGTRQRRSASLSDALNCMGSSFIRCLLVNAVPTTSARRKWI